MHVNFCLHALGLLKSAPLPNPVIQSSNLGLSHLLCCKELARELLQLTNPLVLGEKTPSLPLIGPHPISSTLSSLGAAVNRGTAGDMFKNYMSPISPAANKIYPLSSQAVQAAHFMSASHAPNYSPSMSPIPTQLNAAAFPRFHHKSTSPKLQGLYNTSKLQGGLYNSPQGSFEALDPTGMISFSHQLHKPANTNLTNQQLFYQRYCLS